MDHKASQETIKTLSPSRREIDLNISPAEVEQEFERILTEYTAKAKLAGFRKGKAPRDLVRSMFLPEIRNEIIESLVPRVLGEKLKAENLHPVSVPEVKEAHFGTDQALQAQVAFEILPDFDLPAYKKIRLDDQKADVDDKEIQAGLEELRQRAAEYVPAEGRGAADGDYVVVEIQGRDIGTKKLFPAEKEVVLMGHVENEKAINENLQGSKPGEEKVFSISYPKDHANKKLAGREVEYRLKVNAIKEKKIPPLDDDLAKTLGDTESLEELKGKIKAQILASKEKLRRNKQASEILRIISSGISLEVPESLVVEETRAVLSRMLNALPKAQLNKEQVERLAAESRNQAGQNIKNNLILNKIAEKEGFTVSEEDIQKELKALAEANQIPLARVNELVNKEGKRSDLEETLLFRKTVDFLIEQAIIE